MSVVLFALPPALATAADSCPNAQLRTGPSATLPDCRAYEQVTPPDKNGYDTSAGNQAVAPSGDSITYTSFGSFANAPVNNVFNQYLSVRGPSGWSTQGTSPPLVPASTFNGGENYEGFSSDLSHSALTHQDPPFDGATPGAFDLYRRDADGSLHLISIGQGAAPCCGHEPEFAGASSDWSHILFEDPDPITPGAPSPAVYEWVNGTVSLVSILPNGTPSQGFVGRSSGVSTTNAISSDGSRIYWSNEASTSIYLRENSSTTEITASQCNSMPSCTTGSGVGTYLGASTDGSKALFTSNERLTNASTATNADAGDLYQWDANTGKLADLTVDATDPNGADLQGVLGASSDLSYVYFVADGVLASGATAGQPNVYVRHAATTTFVATLSPSDSSDWNQRAENPRSRLAQVSADGLHLLFTSSAPPASGYNNNGHNEVYRYDASGSGSLTCASCNPSGAPAIGDADLAAAAAATLNFCCAVLNPNNNMSADGGRVFFESSDAVLPQDSNGLENVYEWEADGTGGCHTGGGCVYSISSGRSSSPSYFEDATPSGNDVFFLTREQLVGQDADGNVDVYDARVGGGFAAPPPPPVPCSPEACHGQPSGAPAVPVAASVSFFGPGSATAGSVAAGAKPRVRVLSTIVHGATFVVRVQVPGRGRVTISGSAIRTVRRRLATAGTYRLTVSLAGKAKTALRRKHKLRVRTRVVYDPVGGASSTVAMTLTVER